MKKETTICYFGIYNPEFSRNKIFMDGFRENGTKLVECRDDSAGILKFFRLFSKHWKIRNNYDALIVGYPGHLVVPFAKLISKKIVIADLLGSLEDAEANSHSPSFSRKIKSKIIDWLAIKCADFILLESFAQKEFFERKFGRSDKYKVVYTGVDKKWVVQSGFERTPNNFLVVFRGRLTPESGISHIIEAARLLKDEKINFRILGGGQMLANAKKLITKFDLKNVELISDFLPAEKMISLAGEGDLSLGQFEDNPRLNRTVPHKAFESLAAGVPYLSGDAPAVKEIIEEGKTGFFSPLADPILLARKIKSLSNNRKLLKEVSQNGKELFANKFAPRRLAKGIISIIK